MSLKYEPSSEPLNISAKQWLLNGAGDESEGSAHPRALQVSEGQQFCADRPFQQKVCCPPPFVIPTGVPRS